MAPATFYTVNGPRGVYYAVRNHQTGKVWTERTEVAAQQQAVEEKLAIVASETVDHAQLLDMMIAEASHALAAHAPAAPAPLSHDAPTRIGFKFEGGLTRFLKRFHREEKHNAAEGSSTR